MNLRERLVAVVEQRRAALERGHEVLEEAKIVWRPSGRHLVRCAACGAVQIWKLALPPDATELRHNNGCVVQKLADVLEEAEDA